MTEQWDRKRTVECARTIDLAPWKAEDMNVDMIVAFARGVLGMETEMQKLLADAVALREAADWVMHLAHGIAKNGGPPTDHEWTEAQDALMAAIKDAAYLEKGEAPPTYKRDAVELREALGLALMHAEGSLRNEEWCETVYDRTAYLEESDDTDTG